MVSVSSGPPDRSWKTQYPRTWRPGYGPPHAFTNHTLSVRQRVGPHLELHHLAHRSLAGLAVERCARGPRRPYPLARPAFRTLLPGRLRPIQRALAFTAIETRQMSARDHGPHHAVAIDVQAARPEALHCRLGVVPREFIDLRERRLRRMRARIQPHHR